VIGEYAIWEIFFISTDNCSALSHSISIEPLTDLTIFNRSDLDSDIRKHNWNAPGARGFVASIQEEIAGVCWYYSGYLMKGRPIGLLRPDEAELLQITIGRQFRNRRLGRTLIAETAFHMKQAGYKKLYAQIWHSNHSSKHAFRAAGWEKVGTVYKMAPIWSRQPIEIRRKLPLAHDQGALANWSVDRQE